MSSTWHWGVRRMRAVARDRTNLASRKMKGIAASSVLAAAVSPPLVWLPLGRLPDPVTASAGLATPSRVPRGLEPQMTFGVIPPQLPSSSELVASVRAVGALAQDHPFLVHLYTNWADYPGALPALDAEVAAYATRHLEVDLALRYVPPAGHDGDVAGFAAFVSQMVVHFAHVPAVTMIQVTNEANSPVNPAASDGFYLHAERALVAGVEAGAVARARSGSRVRVGFNWFYSFGPLLDRLWWARLGTLGGARFAGDVDWVGIDAYPGTYYPPLSPRLDPTDLGASASAEVAHIAWTVRHQLMPLAGLGRRTPIGFSEIGWATAPLVRSASAQARIVSAFVAGACQSAGSENLRFLQWYDLVDPPGSIGSASSPLQMGLLGADFAPTPGFDAYREAIARGC